MTTGKVNVSRKQETKLWLRKMMHDGWITDHTTKSDWVNVTERGGQAGLQWLPFTNHNFAITFPYGYLVIFNCRKMIRAVKFQVGNRRKV